MSSLTGVWQWGVTPFPILTFWLWDQRDDDQEGRDKKREEEDEDEDEDEGEEEEEEEEEDEEEQGDSSSESETEGADLSHVSTGSESELEPSPLFLMCKPSVKRKTEKESEGREEKKKEQDQQTELTLESLGKLVVEAEVIQITCKKTSMTQCLHQELRAEVEKLEEKVKQLDEAGSAQVPIKSCELSLISQSSSNRWSQKWSDWNRRILS